MNTLWHRKLPLLALAFSMVFILSRILTVAIRNAPSGAAPAEVSLPPRAEAAPLLVKAPVAKLQKVHLTKTIPAIPKEIFGLKLRTYLRSYSMIFSGKINCQSTPCEAQVQVALNTDQNPNILKSITTSEDGTYSLAIPLQDYMHSQVDWRIVAFSPYSDRVEAHGRQILMDDPSLTIENSLALN